jgi:hypothetical protein
VTSEVSSSFVQLAYHLNLKIVKGSSHIRSLPISHSALDQEEVDLQVIPGEKHTTLNINSHAPAKSSIQLSRIIKCSSKCSQCSSKIMEVWISLTIVFLLQFVIRCHASAGASVRGYTSLQTTHDSLNPLTKSLAGCAKKL